MKKLLKMVCVTVLSIVMLAVTVVGFELGARTARYLQRGFTVQEALRWTIDEITAMLPETEDNPYLEKEIPYNVNSNVDVVPCVDL